MRIREPKTTALIFASDKMVVTGAKTQRDAWAACRKFSQTLQKPGFPTEIADFKIQNIVSSFDCKFPIRLEGIAVAKFGSVSYEPELYPGLVYRLQAPKVVVLMFASGKVVLTGAKSKDDISGAFDAIRPWLQMLGMSETKSVRKKQPGSRAWVSIIECISALGHALDPLIIYKGKTVQQQWFPLDLSPYKG
ncbi:tata-binding protein [Colletotrichum tabaci]|uniref:Tata-binding protein n=1 Tax=Colletotrichum tabaci TaxID=1209068 RepID=A0AAV9TIU7_9PEZI